MTPTRTEIVLALLDDVLGEKFGGDKVQNLRQIEHAAKRMADGIEMIERDRARWRERMTPTPASQESTAPTSPPASQS